MATQRVTLSHPGQSSFGRLLLGLSQVPRFLDANQSGDRYASTCNDDLGAFLNRIDIARKMLVCFSDAYEFFHGKTSGAIEQCLNQFSCSTYYIVRQAKICGWHG
jgi:hypothetical protein